MLTTQQLLLSVAPLVLGCLHILLHPLKLKEFQGVYLFLSACWVFIHFQFLPEVSMTWIIATIVLAEVLQFLIVGLAGSSLGTSTYSTILVGVGLFPWYLEWRAGAAYFVFFLFTSFVWSKTNALITKRRYRVHGNKTLIRGMLTKEEYLEFTQSLATKLSGPAAISAMAAVLLTQAT